MKKFAVFAFVALFTVTSVVIAYADAVSQYGVDITDASSYDNQDYNLFQLFNTYFSDQLGADGFYESSNDLFNARGVDPNTNWISSGTQVVGAYKVAGFDHTMSIIDSMGNNLGNMYSTSGNIVGEVGIVDISGQNVGNIPDGLLLDFRLDAYLNGNLMYSWASNPDENDGRFGTTSNDGMVHMLALDITDLYNTKYGTDNNSVFMFAWEDLSLSGNGFMPADWDYQDFVAIITNVAPSDDAFHAIPEPATMLIFGWGFIGLGAAQRRWYRKQ